MLRHGRSSSRSWECRARSLPRSLALCRMTYTCYGLPIYQDQDRGTCRPLCSCQSNTCSPSRLWSSRFPSSRPPVPCSLGAGCCAPCPCSSARTSRGKARGSTGVLLSLVWLVVGVGVSGWHFVLLQHPGHSPLVSTLMS